MSEKFLEWRQFRVTVWPGEGTSVGSITGRLNREFDNPDASFRMTHSGQKYVHGKPVAALVMCDYVAKGANANDARQKIAQALKGVSIREIEVRGVARIEVATAVWPFPGHMELLERWQPGYVTQASLTG